MIPKLAFLFLTIADVYHEPVWMNFFQGHEDSYSVYVHSKVPLSQDSFFKNAEIPLKVETSWQNTMNAQIELLKAALIDPDNTKFIFLSESTLPLQTFAEVYETLMQHEGSQFNYYRNPHYYRSFSFLKPRSLYKNAQWVVLNRYHAQLMADDDLLLPLMTNDPHDQEHYPSTFLAKMRLLSDICKKDTTLCIWNGGDAHPHTFTDLTNDQYWPRLMRVIKHKRFLFARKFDKECDLQPLKPYLSFIP